MSTRATEIEAEVDTWPGTTTDAHRFECREFSLGAQELGRLHGGVQLEIPFAKRVRDVLIEDADVPCEIHEIYPNSGWTTLPVEDDEDVALAIDLLRLSYLYQVASLQRRDAATRELSLIDVGRELEDLEVPERARELVAERFDLERPERDRVADAALADETAESTETEGGPVSETERKSDDASGDEGRDDESARGHA